MTRTAASTGLGPLLALCGALVWTSCGDGGDSAPTITITGSIADASTFAPLEDVRICLYEHHSTPCAHTDADGSYSMDVPASSELIFEVTRDGYWPYLTNFLAPGIDYEFPGPLYIFSEAEVLAGAASLGETIDAERGHLWVTVSDARTVDGASGLPGAALDLDPGAGGILFFVDDDQSLSKTRTTTSSQGMASYMNAAPGDWILQVSHPDLECKPEHAFAGPQANSFRVHLTAGYTTSIFVYCD